MDLLRNVPLGLYLEQPISALHRLDARVKLLWLSTFLLTPILANNIWRLGIVGALTLITLLVRVPLRIWLRQVGLVLTIALIGTLATAIAPDGLGVTPAPMRSSSVYRVVSAPESNVGVDSAGTAFESGDSGDAAFVLDQEPIPAPATAYRYELLQLRPLEGLQAEGFNPEFIVTRRSLSVAIRFGTLIFTLIYSTNLFLLTTAAEDIAAALAYFLAPLKRLNLPINELILTLTLALRFLPLVLEEMQNIARAVRTRDIRWQMLGLRGAIQVSLRLVERFLENLLQRAAQTAAAMQVRGYTGTDHTVPWQILRLSWRDRLLLVLIPLVWGWRLWQFQI